MRTLLILGTCGLATCAAMAPSAAVMAQVAPAGVAEQLAPGQPLFSDPVAPVPAPAAAPSLAQPVVEAARTPPPAPEGPTTVAPVLVEGQPQPQPNAMARKVGVTVGGLLGGVAGAAGGPVGKFAGAFVGKRLAKNLLDRNKDDGAPQLEVVQAQAFSAADAGRPALAEPATAPALAPASDPRPF